MFHPSNTSARSTKKPPDSTETVDSKRAVGQTGHLTVQQTTVVNGLALVLDGGFTEPLSNQTSQLVDRICDAGCASAIDDTVSTDELPARESRPCFAHRACEPHRIAKLVERTERPG